MARKTRVEIAGGLYHVIFRGNNRREIFSSPADFEKFLTMLAVRKSRLPFFLYAYYLMTNHVHLLIVAAEEPVQPTILSTFIHTSNSFKGVWSEGVCDRGGNTAQLAQLNPAALSTDSQAGGYTEI